MVCMIVKIEMIDNDKFNTKYTFLLLYKISTSHNSWFVMSLAMNMNETLD